MKTNISNFFVLVVIFFVGLVSGFLFSVQKTEPFFWKFQIGEKNYHLHKKEREKTSGVALGTFFERRPTSISIVTNATIF